MFQKDMLSNTTRTLQKVHGQKMEEKGALVQRLLKFMQTVFIMQILNELFGDSLGMWCTNKAKTT